METENITDNANMKVESSTEPTDTSLNKNQNFNHNRRGRGRGGKPYGRQQHGKADGLTGGRGGFGGGSRFRQNQDSQSQEDVASVDGRMTRNAPRGMDEKIHERLSQFTGGTYDLPPVDQTEKKFSSRNRLYIGNIGAEITDKDLEELFQKYGECSEIFINNEKNFGFIKLDYHCNAEKAKSELDGTTLKSRNLKIRFAPNTASIKVKNLTPYVSNELLWYTFSVFGEIERATVCVDERGKPTGEGIIDFSRKGCALSAIRKCSESCLFLTSSLRPCIVEAYEAADTSDGYPEKNVNKKNFEYQREREVGPRLAVRGSFEDEFGIRWKQLYDLHSQKEEALKKELELEIEKLEAQMEYAKYEHETEVLRNQLRAREMSKEKQKREWEMKQRQAEQERLRIEELMRRSQEEIDARMRRQQEECKRRQEENSLFRQAQNLDTLLEMQETAYEGPSAEYTAVKEEPAVTDPSLFYSSYERQTETVTRYPAENGGVWVTDSSRQKRRRY